MIDIQHLTFGYPKQNKLIFSDFSMKIPPLSRWCLKGENGKGKTTLFRLILGLEKPQKGKIIHDEKGFSVVFQEDRLIPSLSIKENVALFSDDDRAEEILADLNLADHLRDKPADLSGGMKRRVAIARALAHPSTALLLDEALTGLDEKTFQKTIQVIDEYSKDRILLMITHNDREAEWLSAENIYL